MDIKELYNLYKINYKVTTDTRSDLMDSIFFALKGDNFNGNEYAIDAINKGAKYAVVDEKISPLDDRIILVDNVLHTLQDLARFHRQSLGIPVIALTGSNGKTTTKELIYSVLREKFNCVATKGNLNNHIGVPLTLFSLKLETEIAVIEMGANHPNEIKMLCEIALPDFGYITNFGKVHLEGFGSLEGVIKAKSELYDHLRERNKIVFVNTNDSVQVSQTHGINKISFGNKNSDYPIEFLQANPFVELKFKDIEVSSKLIGRYNYLNIATAIAIGQYFNISDERIKKGIESYIPTNNRSQIIDKGTNKIILDAYNANPNSMEVAIENLAQLSEKKKIAILGDMFEIGENSLLEHQNIVDLIVRSKIDKCILIGEMFAETKIENKNIVQFKTYDEFKKNIHKLKIEEATILIKASRGMALERVLEII